MELLALLRHGDTAWSAEGRLQGRTDVPLTDGGRAAIRSMRLPKTCAEMRIITSPLARCVETAALLGAPQAVREPRIAEMSWGEWEGRRLAELRAQLGAAMARYLFKPSGVRLPPVGGAAVTRFVVLHRAIRLQ